MDEDRQALPVAETYSDITECNALAIGYAYQLEARNYTLVFEPETSSSASLVVVSAPRVLFSEKPS